MNAWKTLKQNAPESEILRGLIDEADAVVVGIGAGMSAADGFTYIGDRFKNNFPDFIEKYNWFDMLQASLFKFPTLEEYWAFQSRFIVLNYLDQPAGEAYIALKEMIEEKPYHVITTNADNAFYAADYNMDKVLYYQGEYVRMQCSDFCHDETYRDDELMRKMASEQQNMEIPSELIPYCPKCGAPMEKNKRTAEKGMVEDEKFNAQRDDYNAFLKEHQEGKVMYLEIGVGHTTPQFIKHPFWRQTRQNENALFVTMNQKTYRIPEAIKSQTVFLTEDIGETILNAHKN
ncbi:deacetylase SIR2 [Jeotgalicoccus coquinae]|jgi:NAD-dependent SIR2 family protein deacetylase|uniref:NAD-dependent SIR2 family protein deacetylase n=1 Tax=Jeotgalicoccus coquinae TaxID=709509 RepID=A0A6V7RR13_9STAP|nr:NAD-dependent deacetylase [Jeotgalicoccus coquinae]MBB6424111.1 NAD-dependent SIR2 family protein deacetylase [Jeotgalicoccus coquinae]GGE26450.1 deacetylase SIR2 [Jeotgalicoccus coquinae]CAD2081281.1 Protein ADP-ribosyltransferase [Jeotgalicoccus coquinae]